MPPLRDVSVRMEDQGVGVDNMVGDGRGDTYLKPSDKETVRRHLSETIGAELQQRENAPADVKEGNDPVHREHGKEEHKRYLAHDRADHVHGLQLDQFVAHEPKVVFHPGDVRIVCQ